MCISFSLNIFLKLLLCVGIFYLVHFVVMSLSNINMYEWWNSDYVVDIEVHVINASGKNIELRVQ